MENRTKLGFFILQYVILLMVADNYFVAVAVGIITYFLIMWDDSKGDGKQWIK